MRQFMNSVFRWVSEILFYVSIRCAARTIVLHPPSIYSILYQDKVYPTLSSRFTNTNQSAVSTVIGRH